MASRSHPSADLSPRAARAPVARLFAACAACGALAAGAGGIAGCSSGAAEAAKPPAAPPVPVVVATAERRDVPMLVHAVGTVKPSAVVAVRSQITGTLMTVGFTEGAEVAAGQTLFTIDTRPLEQALKQAAANRQRSVAAQRQAEAALVRDQAQAAHAEKDWQRLAGLPAGIATHDEVESARATADADAATVVADRAAIDTAVASLAADQAAEDAARVQLGYGTITAPCAGRVGALTVNVGNLVTANSDVLVTINALKPVYATFAVPEAHLPDLRRYAAAGAVAVQAAPGADPARARAGTIDLIDNQVDATTGTIGVRAVFANADTALWPGEYVDVAVTLTTRSAVVVVPSQAVQVGQRGQFVYVIGDDHKASAQPVTVGPTVAGMTIVDQGLQAGQTVVIDGQMKIATGTLTTVAPPVGSAPATGAVPGPGSPGAVAATASALAAAAQGAGR
jgi:multidrug efflux system membrane fusion protein